VKIHPAPRPRAKAHSRAGEEEEGRLPVTDPSLEGVLGADRYRHPYATPDYRGWHERKGFER
jgi:hypothetical protein